MIYCTLCFCLISCEDIENDVAWQAANGDWYCCEQHYWDSRV